MKTPRFQRCMYCDASIAGEHEFDAQLHDPYCPHGKALLKLQAAQKRISEQSVTISQLSEAVEMWMERAGRGAP